MSTTERKKYASGLRTQAQITAVAREILAQTRNPADVTFHEVARRLGRRHTTLYRHADPGPDGLLALIRAAAITELREAVATAAEHSDPNDLPGTLTTLCRTVFDWAIANGPEFGLLLSVRPGNESVTGGEQPSFFAALGPEVGGTFIEAYLNHGPTPLPDAEVPPALVISAERYGQTLRPDMPLGLAYQILTCWRHLYGVICMGVYGHLEFADGELQPLFEDTMSEILQILNLNE